MSQANFIVYKSSAGSGKTFTLVKEYLKLALAGKSGLFQDQIKAYRGILAITFTNKAASEMKWRIIKALKDISSKQNDFLANLIAKEIGISVEELESRADAVLTDILHNYSDFSIGTIDSFTHRIIRTFALDLKLPINFQIETDADAVFERVISLLINNLGKDESITNYLLEYSKRQVEDNKHWDPEQSLIEFIREINKEGVNHLVEQLAKFNISDFDTIKNQVSTHIKSYEQFLKQAGQKGLDLIKSKQLSSAAFYYADKGIYNFYKKMADLSATTQTDLFKTYVNDTLSNDKWFAGKTSANDKLAIEAIKDELIAIAESVRSYLIENEERYNVFKLIYKNIYAMGLVNELAKLTQEYKNEENILFISEFNERISSVVNNEPTPFIFERLGDRYKHFLLDEFQDTSGMQWQNMLPLIDNSLGNGNLNLIVGDGKQSIYRWRNADVEQFVNLPYVNAFRKSELVEEREASLVRNFKQEVLKKNFRSESTVVKFNNQLFEHLSQTVLHDELKKIYDNQEQEYKNEDGGYVSIDFPDTTDTDNDEVNTRYVLDYVKKAIEDGYEYSDICIIIRKNSHGNTVANFLIEKGIPVVSADSLLLGNSEEVNVVLAFLKYLSNQKDLVSASVIINHLFLNRICNEQAYVNALRTINVSKNKSLFQILNELGLSINEAKVTSANLFDVCVEVSNALVLNERNPQYIRFFLDEILTFLQGHTSNVAVFLDWWERRETKASVVIPEGINAVNIMTIHASKGLEFPIVITPYLAWKTEKAQAVWVDIDEKDIELPVALVDTSKTLDETKYKHISDKEKQQQVLDALNLLYVDFTRAVERLHIISPKLKKEDKSNCHNWLRSFVENKPEYDVNTQQYAIGSLNNKQLSQHQKSSLSQLPIATLNLSGNQDVVKIKGASQYNFNEELVKAREYGILVHYVLSQIKTLADVSGIIQKTVQSGDITSEEALKIERDINQLLQLPIIKSYFEDGVIVKNEVEILTAEGEILRPDRVVIANEQAIVIDYKTGKKNSSKYHLQMKAYEQALLSLGYQSVKKILLYINEQDVELV